MSDSGGKTLIGGSKRRQALADFLRTRRARLSYAEVGLFPGRRRRTPGLRREEVAELANVGISWYTSLEQGRDIQPSEQVLNSLAEALRLSPDERKHLFLLANQNLETKLRPVPDKEEVSPALGQLLDALEPNPAFILNRYWDYLAWNQTANRLFSITATSANYPYNFVWRLFTRKDKQQFYPEWSYRAQLVLAEFRAASTSYLDDPYFRDLIEDLQQASSEFNSWWQRHDVRGILGGPKNICHPQAGELKLEHIILQVPTQPTLKLMVYLPLGDSAAKLELLSAEA